MSAALVRRYQQAYNLTRLEAARRVEAIWARLGGLTEDEAARFLTAALPVVEGAQRAVAALVDGYLSEMSRRYTGSATSGVVDFDEIRNARGVPPQEVYQRPVVTARTAIAQGKAYREALRLGGIRAGVLAQDDVALAQQRSVFQVVGRNERIVGYRRTLTGASCGLCATASTQRYTRGDLMPIHGRCDCGIAPIFGTEDPGRVVNSQRTVEAAPTAVRTHGELGPVLTRPGDEFTGPGDIAA